MSYICRTILFTKPMKNDSLAPAQLESFAAQLKVLAHPMRLAIVGYLSKPATGQRSVTEIYEALKLPQAIASQHLITLKDRRVLKSQKVGTKIFYEVAAPWAAQLLTLATQHADVPAPGA